MPCMLLATSLSDGKRNLIMKWSTTPIRYLNSPPPPQPCQKKKTLGLSIMPCMYLFAISLSDGKSNNI